MLVILHSRLSDNGVSLTVPANKDITYSDLDKHAQELHAQNPDYNFYKIVDDSTIPGHTFFFNAWTHDGTNLNIDMTKAVEIHKNKLRELRQPLLDKLDVAYYKALEKNDTTTMQQLSTQKQTLRDVTKLQFPNNPTDLSNFIPDCLK